MKKKTRLFLLGSIFFVLAVLSILSFDVGEARVPAKTKLSVTDKCLRVLEKAEELARTKISYTPDYISLSYPGGDVPANTGVCTDVVIRSFRNIGIDLQKEVHESIKKSRADYPNNWGLKSADKNIDHRRVANLMVYFKKHGTVLPISEISEDYSPCDIVTWDLGGGLTHIGIVSQHVSRKSGRPLIIHHIGGNPSKDDMIFSYKVIGHFALLSE